MRAPLTFLLPIAAALVAPGCGTVADATDGDASPDATHVAPPHTDAASGQPRDAGSPRTDSGKSSSLDARADVGNSSPPEAGTDGASTARDASDATLDRDATLPTDASTHDPDAAPSFDAGYYYGDGSFFVDASTDAPADAPTGAREGGVIDASPGCAALAACCPSLPTSSEGVCDAVAGSGDAPNCAAELQLLEGAGECTGATVLASQVQIPPYLLVSDGTLLFWTTTSSPGLLSMPVTGGPITVLLAGPVSQGASINGVDVYSGFLAVDDANVYVLDGTTLVRIPKNGAPATRISGQGAYVPVAASLSGSAFWIEVQQSGITSDITLKSVPLQGGATSVLAQFTESSLPVVDVFGVTSTEAFVGMHGYELLSVPRGGGTASQVDAGASCDFLSSDVDAVYCAESGGSNLRIASDGSATSLGTAVMSMPIVYDDTYAYWVDDTTVGTLMKSPKAGGGAATVVARDANPTAVAVDAHAVYWGDQDGYLKSIAK